MQRTWMSAAALMVACAPQGGIVEVETETEVEANESALTRAERRCLRKVRRGVKPAWQCGGREAALAAPFAEACPDRQWVAYRRGAEACPEVRSHRGEWHLSRPFARARDNKLQRVCLYTWNAFDADHPEPDVAAFPDDPSLRLERDCEVVTGHATPAAVTDALRESWAAQVELPDWSVANNEGAPDPAEIRVAVVDGGYGGVSWSDQLPADTVNHAEAMSSIVRAVGCPNRGADGYCAVGAPAYAAMPYVRRDLAGELGGFFGTHVEYARAVTAAVDDWRTEPARSRPAGLVLNLSLGWTATHDVSRTGRLSGQVALWATRYAACRGALLIAAAGNRSVESGVGPLYPAGWEALPRNCGDAGDDAAYAPLVHAVGGVDGRDEPLAVARDGGHPRLVAAASQVAVQLETTSSQGSHTATKAMSGTSMAAAAASGVAGMVWSLRPNLKPWQVMQRVRSGAEPLGVSADFAYAGNPQRRRLSASGAFAAACPDGVVVGRCPTGGARPALADPRPAGVAEVPDYAAIAALLYDEAIDVEADPGAPDPPAIEGAYGSPWVVPQPGTPTCPICGFVGDLLVGELAADPAPWPAQVYAKTASDTFIVKLGLLEYGVPFKIDLAGSLPIDELKSAWLLVPTTSQGAIVYTSSELFID